MTKEDLNRQFGDPEKQKPVTPLELLAAAHLIREYCNTIPRGGCQQCIFNKKNGCMLYEINPSYWELSHAEYMTCDWIEKQFPSDFVHYLDTDKYTDE